MTPVSCSSAGEDGDMRAVQMYNSAAKAEEALHAEEVLEEIRRASPPTRTICAGMWRASPSRCPGGMPNLPHACPWAT